jgi:carbon monoxide dehydrogenase subunit G
MTVSGTFTFRGPRALVFQLLQDPEVLVTVMPGAQRLAQVGDGRYQGLMKVGLGPVTAAEFSLEVALGDLAPPERFTMAIDSKGTLGFARGTATVALDEQGPEQSVMHYTSELQIGGRIASVGQRVVESAAKAMTARGLQALQQAIDDRLATSPGSTSS